MCLAVSGETAPDFKHPSIFFPVHFSPEKSLVAYRYFINGGSMDCFRFFRFVSLLALVSGGSLSVFGQDSLKVATMVLCYLNVLIIPARTPLLQVLGKRSTDSTWVPVTRLETTLPPRRKKP